MLFCERKNLLLLKSSQGTVLYSSAPQTLQVHTQNEMPSCHAPTVQACMSGLLRSAWDPPEELLAVPEGSRGAGTNGMHMHIRIKERRW